jgi:CRP-like cAMP-binding protein
MPLTPPTGPCGNLLLDRLPEPENDALADAAELVSLRHGHEVYREGGPLAHAYFPTTGVLSLVVPLTGGRRVEGTTIGHEGMAGLPAFLGLDFSPQPVFAQVPGEAYRVPMAAFLQAARPGGVLDRLMRRYAAYMFRYASQAVACNAIHTVEERAGRWLLSAHDRAGKDEFSLTQEYLAEMLGVRRQSVSLVAASLQDAGFIRYTRGRVTVTDRAGLERASCECYEVTKRLYERILG